MKYILLFILLLPIALKAQTGPNAKDSFYMYRTKANAAMDSVNRYRNVDTIKFNKFCRERQFFIKKQEYWERKFYGF